MEAMLGFWLEQYLLFWPTSHPKLPSKFQVNWPLGSGEEAKNRFSRRLPSWISDLNGFSYFLTYKLLPIKLRVNCRFLRKPSWFSYDFSYFWDLQVTPMLPTKFQVNLLSKLLMTQNEGQTLIDQNSSPWALCVQVSKKRHHKFQHCGFILHNIFQSCVAVYTGLNVYVWRLAFIEAENSVTKHFIGEKEKWTNKRNNKHEDADCFLHNTTNHIQCLYQISWEIFE